MTRHKKEHTADGNGKASTGPIGDGVVLVDDSFRPIAVDTGAELILNGADGQSEESHSGVTLPPAIVDQLNGHHDSESLPKPQQFSIGDREYSSRAFLLKPLNSHLDKPVLALYFRREISVAEAVQMVGVEYRLTDREQEALIGVTMGLTSKELATRMHISPNTVKAFLRLIMIKMGVTTRAGIVGKLLDQNARLSDGRESPRFQSHEA